MNKILLTNEGLKELKTELENLLNIERKNVIVELQNARAQGDLSENADYDAARNKQGQIEARIKEIQLILVNHKIIKHDSKKVTTVKVGTTVKVKNLVSKKNHIYTIVGSIEADPFQGRISNESPLAKAIIGKEIGTVAHVKAPTGYDVKIIKIDN